LPLPSKKKKTAFASGFFVVADFSIKVEAVLKKLFGK